MKTGLTSWIPIPEFVYLFLFIVCPVSIFSETITWGNKKNPFPLYFVSEAHVTSKTSGEQTISLERQPYPVSYDESLDSFRVSFDKDNSYLRSGEILKAEYKTVSFEDSVGEAASFEQPLHEMWISPADFLFLNQSKNTGDFSIYFRMRPYQFKRRMDILQKVGLFEGQKQGIYCGWEDGKLFYSFYNFFWKDKGGPVGELKISTRDRIQANRFYSVMLLYKNNEGSLTLYLDGAEQEKIFVTADGLSGGTILTPRFHRWDRSPLIIGRNYLGALDDIVVSNHILSPEIVSGQFNKVESSGFRYFQKPGVAVSRRIDLPVSGARIESLKIVSNEPPGSRVKIFYRYSDIPFTDDASEFDLPYNELVSQKLPGIRGRYFQWKAELYADSSGVQTPVIQSVSLEYSVHRLPQVPTQLSVLEASQESVTLEFLRSLEMDVVKGGRYHVYYGIKPYYPLGVIKFKSFEIGPDGELKGIPITNDDKWITDDQRYQNRIKITITNQMISENLSFFRKTPGLLYPYPLLQKDIPYYFWVTSCDQDWSEKLEKSDHESRPSPYVVVRIR